MIKKTLLEVSDGLCKKEDFFLEKFDNIDSIYAKVDGVFEQNNSIYLVEFKNLTYVSLNEWLSSKCICEETGITYKKKVKCNKENLLLKAYESYLFLKTRLENKKVWFLFVYSYSESSKSNNKFKEFFKKNLLKRLNIVYDECHILECNKFLKFLDKLKGE